MAAGLVAFRVLDGPGRAAVQAPQQGQADSGEPARREAGRGGGEADRDRGGAGGAPGVSLSRVLEAAQDGVRKNPVRVAPLGGGALPRPVHRRQRRLALPLVEAAAGEVAEGRALPGYPVPDAPGRLVEPDPPVAGRPQAQVGVLGPGHVADLAEVLAEAADGLEHRGADGHVPGPHVADRLRPLGHPLIGEADGPAELDREPPRPGSGPQRVDPPAHADDVRPAEMAQQRRQPALGGPRVVVKERDDLAVAGMRRRYCEPRTPPGRRRSR